MDSTLGIVILAAGLGTRMKSNKAKVLHEVCGRTMIEHVVQTATRVAGSNVVVVVGHQAEQVQQKIAASFDVSFALQHEQLGTGHAVLCAMPHLAQAVDHVVILCGDVPLIQAETIKGLVDHHRQGARDVTLLAVTMNQPKGYGRVLTDENGGLVGIVEESDADPEQKKINVVNTGIYAVQRHFLNFALPLIESDNAQNEIYLTDIIAIGHDHHKIMGTLIGDDDSEIIGVNSPVELQMVETIMKKSNLEKS